MSVEREPEFQTPALPSNFWLQSSKIARAPAPQPCSIYSSNSLYDHHQNTLKSRFMTIMTIFKRTSCGLQSDLQKPWPQQHDVAPPFPEQRLSDFSGDERPRGGARRRLLTDAGEAQCSASFGGAWVSPPSAKNDSSTSPLGPKRKTRYVGFPLMDRTQVSSFLCSNVSRFVCSLITARPTCAFHLPPKPGVGN